MVFREGSGGHSLGYTFTQGDSGISNEYDVRTCIHCNTVVFFGPGTGRKGFCRKCMDIICANRICVERGCRPFEKHLEEVEKLSRELENRQ